MNWVFFQFQCKAPCTKVKPLKTFRRRFCVQ